MNEKYDRIIKTALHLFIKLGFQNTPTALIAKEAGVANGTLFHYFKNKDILINSVFLSCKDSMVITLKSNISAEMNIPAVARILFTNAINWCMTNSEMFLFFQTYNNSPFITKGTKDDYIEKFHFIVQLIEVGKREGYLKNISTDLLYSTINGLMFQMMNFFYEKKENINNSQEIDEAFIILWDAIKK
ncbi:MAG: TetR/AcrR family transcriptional regulator [Bacteroidota bacterium]|nr:MAG: TetR/AcrR family transcriptional regulator [Bacteroidota bacterium]